MTMKQSYPIVDTGQSAYYDASNIMQAPEPGAAFAGQDAQYQGLQPAYWDNGDGTITDLNTGLIWQQVPLSQVTYAEARDGADDLSLAGYADWRLPSIKELYSLMDFRGYTGNSAGDSAPYLDTSYFSFEYGDTAGNRFMDAQYWSATEYLSTTILDAATTFGVNFADGRIKGYPNGTDGGMDMERYVRYVRGNTDYGENAFVDNKNGTISDQATGLMWLQADSSQAMTWQEALAWAENLEYGGYDDWRLPNAKELQSLIDYGRAPDVTGSAAIDPLFMSSSIKNEGGALDYPFYWTGTTHVENGSGDYAVYLSFGRALGWMDTPSTNGHELMDVHGAGAQRSDPKTGSAADYPDGFGPQGDVIRIENYARPVRDMASDDKRLGTSANDQWINTTADESFDGGEGIDSLQFALASNHYSLGRTDASIGVTGPQGHDSLSGVERLLFADQKLAFDLAATENAGMALEFINVLTPSLITDAAACGLILCLFDQGHGFSSLFQEAISVGLVGSLAGGDSNQAIANMAYQNLIGSPADQATTDMLVGYMDGTTANYSQADFLATVAGLGIHQPDVAILLSGMQQTGMEYI
jgi:lysozyme family protein